MELTNEQWERIKDLVPDLTERGGVDLSECFVDGSLKHGQKGALLWARLSEAKALSS